MVDDDQKYAGSRRVQLHAAEVWRAATVLPCSLADIQLWLKSGQKANEVCKADKSSSDLKKQRSPVLQHPQSHPPRQDWQLYAIIYRLDVHVVFSASLCLLWILLSS